MLAHVKHSLNFMKIFIYVLVLVHLNIWNHRFKYKWEGVLHETGSYACDEDCTCHNDINIEKNKMMLLFLLLVHDFLLNKRILYIHF